MKSVADQILGRSPETLPTLPELAMYVKAGRMNKYGAAEYAMARRDAGLCDYCSRQADDESGACNLCGGRG